jgi:hypothetical protein
MQNDFFDSIEPQRTWTTPPEIDANDAYRLLMDRQRFRSRWNFCIARKRKLKGGPTPVCTETLFELMT